MREIRFRAWFPGPNVMGIVTNLKGSNVGYAFDGVVAECFIGGRQVFYEAYKNFVLMQYTGLKDRHGKEIYEGDIVTFLDGSYISTESGIDTDEFMSTGAIEWCNERKGWDVTNREDVATDECFDEYMEVIGNIYENPELLKP